jgi:hypothetical protein
MIIFKCDRCCKEYDSKETGRPPLFLLRDDNELELCGKCLRLLEMWMNEVILAPEVPQ